MYLHTNTAITFVKALGEYNFKVYHSRVSAFCVKLITQASYITAVISNVPEQRRSQDTQQKNKPPICHQHRSLMHCKQICRKTII